MKMDEIWWNGMERPSSPRIAAVPLGLSWGFFCCQCSCSDAGIRYWYRQVSLAWEVFQYSVFSRLLKILRKKKYSSLVLWLWDHDIPLWSASQVFDFCTNRSLTTVLGDLPVKTIARWIFLHRPNYLKLAIASRSVTISVPEPFPFICVFTIGISNYMYPGAANSNNYQRSLCLHLSLSCLSCLCVVFQGGTFCYCNDYESLTLTGVKLQATQSSQELHAWVGRQTSRRTLKICLQIGSHLYNNSII